MQAIHADWIKSIKTLHALRTTMHFTKLYDIEIIEDLENILTSAESDEDAAKAFYDAYIAFCSSILDNTKKTAANKQVTDSFTSVSELIFILDSGFDIAMNYLKTHLGSSEIKKKLYDSQIIYEAYTSLDSKKIALMRIADPFDDILAQMENFDKWISEAYEVVETLGIDNMVSYEEFEDKINSLNQLSAAPETKSIVKESLYKVLEERNMCLTVNFNENYSELFAKITNTFPALVLKNYKEEYKTRKNTKKIDFELNGEKISIEIELGSLHKDLVSFINPLLEKHTGRCLLTMPTITRQVFIVAPAAKKRKLLGNSFLFYSN